MDELSNAISKLEQLQSDTTRVSVASAMVDIARFINHDLDTVIDDLKQAESKIATD